MRGAIPAFFLPQQSREVARLFSATVPASGSSPLDGSGGDGAPNSGAGSAGDGPAPAFWAEARLTASEDEMVWKMRQRGSPWDVITATLIERRRQYIDRWNATREETMRNAPAPIQRSCMCCGDLFETRAHFRLCPRHREG